MPRPLPTLVLLFAAATAFAEAKPPVVVMDLEPKGATPLQAEAASQGIARGLRDLDTFQVLSTADVRQLLALERTRQLSGQTAENQTDISTALGARHVISGSLVKAEGESLSVELRLFDTKDAKVIAQKTAGPFAGMLPLATALPGLAQELVAPLLAEQQGTLLVRSKEEGSEVLVDDVLVGSTPLKEPLKLSRGNHRLQVRKDGFIAQVRPVRIEKEQLTVEEFTLVPSADYAEAYAQRHGRLRIGAYIASVVAVGALAGAVYLDRSVTEPTYQKEFVPRQAALNGQLLPEELAADERLKKTWQACGEAEETCRAEMQDLEGRLRVQQFGTIGLATVGVGAAAAATYLFLTGKDPNRYTDMVAGVSVGERTGVAFGFRF